eukprot:PhM_4_TR18875/c4_g2_i1/m.48151
MSSSHPANIPGLTTEPFREPAKSDFSPMDPAKVARFVELCDRADTAGYHIQAEISIGTATDSQGETVANEQSLLITRVMSSTYQMRTVALNIHDKPVGDPVLLKVKPEKWVSAYIRGYVKAGEEGSARERELAQELNQLRRISESRATAEAALNRREERESRLAERQERGFVSTHDEIVEAAAHEHAVRLSFPQVRFPLDITFGKGADKLNVTALIGAYNDVVSGARVILNSIVASGKEAYTKALMKRLQNRADTHFLALEL